MPNKTDIVKTGERGRGMEIQDHPVIRNMELTGYPDGQEPNYPICPICHEETDTFYVDPDEQIVGCDNCIKIRDAWGMIEDDDYWREIE